MNLLKKIMLSEKKMLKKISKNPTYLKLISVLVALLFFVSLNGSDAFGLGDLFETEKYISNIQVNIVSDEGKIVTGIPDKIGVNIRGSEIDVKNFEENSQNIIASINLAGREDGEYEIQKDEFKFSQDYGVDIIPLVNAYDVTIDTLTETTMPVSIEYINKDGNESILLGDPVMNSSNITFEVGQMQKEDISSVKVMLDIADIDTSKDNGVHTFSEPIKVYDKSGNLMEFKEEMPDVEVVQPYEILTITMPVKYQIVNNDTKKYVSYICKDKEGVVLNENCQDEVEVYGNEELIQQMSYITYNVDLKGFDENTPEALATPALENGVFLENDNGYNVKVGLEEGETTTFKNVPIAVENLDETLEVVNLDEINLTLKVTGSKSMIEKLTTNDFEVYIDAIDITGPNILKMPLQVEINNLLTYELSEKEVDVEFKEK